MALRAQSLLLYGFEINDTNYAIDFRAVSAGPILQATLRFGFYSLTSMMAEWKRALESADPAHVYTVTADRTVSGGTQNRVTISTNGSYLDLLFLTGPRHLVSADYILGFNHSDITGATSYVGQSTAGTALVTEMAAYSYLGPEMSRNVFGALSITASGQKEAIVWQVMQFMEMEFRYEPQAKIVTEWSDFFTWAIQQRSFDFTPEITSPNTFYEVTLESSAGDGKGLGYKFTEMLPDFPFFFRTGNIKLRRKL